MPNENLDTTNKLIKPEDISPSDDAIIRQLSDNLQDITSEDVDAMCDEIDVAEKRKKEEEKEKGEIPQELKDFREKWKQKIDLDEDTKKKIIDAVKKIQKGAKEESDGSMLVEFELGGKIYKNLDVNLVGHSDREYLTSCDYYGQSKNGVKLGGMLGDDTSKRKNRKLAEYVEKEKKSRGMEIRTVEFQRDLVNELGNKAGLSKTSDKIAMWMYLTGNYGDYWLTMGNLEKSNSNASSRSLLLCRGNYCGFYYFNNDYDNASLCMIACE